MERERLSIARRTVLAGLVAAPATIALPQAPAAAHAAPSGSEAVPEAALIAQAAAVENLARRELAAMTRVSTLQGRYGETAPQRPANRGDEATARRWQVWDELATGPATPERAHVFQEANRRATAAAQAIRSEHAAALVAWRAECARISREIGLTAAEELQEQLRSELEDAARRLTSTRPSTMAGARAKALAWIAVDHGFQGCQPEEWQEDLAAAIVRDVATLGSAA